MAGIGSTDGLPWLRSEEAHQRGRGGLADERKMRPWSVRSGHHPSETRRCCLKPSWHNTGILHWLC
jgi:hypothetical protein